MVRVSQPRPEHLVDPRETPETEDPNKDFPHIPLDLLEALEKRFPDCIPDPNLVDRDIWIRVGHVLVVRFLRELYDNPKS